MGKTTGRTMSMPEGLAVGGGISLGITLAGTALLAILVDKQIMEMERVGYGILVMLLLGAFLGAMAAYSKIRRRRMLVCLASGAVYMGLLLAITALFFGGQYTGVGTTALVILAGSVTAALLGLGQGRGTASKKYRRCPR